MKFLQAISKQMRLYTSYARYGGDDANGCNHDLLANCIIRSDHSDEALNYCIKVNNCENNFGSLDTDAKAKVMAKFDMDEARFEYVDKRFREDILILATECRERQSAQAALSLTDDNESPIKFGKNGNINA